MRHRLVHLGLALVLALVHLTSARGADATRPPAADGWVLRGTTTQALPAVVVRAHDDDLPAVHLVAVGLPPVALDLTAVIRPISFIRAGYVSTSLLKHPPRACRPPPAV